MAAIIFSFHFILKIEIANPIQKPVKKASEPLFPVYRNRWSPVR